MKKLLLKLIWKIKILIEILEDEEAKATIKLFHIKNIDRDKDLNKALIENLLTNDFSFLAELDSVWQRVLGVS